MEPLYIVRVEDLQPIRAPEVFRGDELVYMVNGTVLIADLEEAAANPLGTSDYRH